MCIRNVNYENDAVFHWEEVFGEVESVEEDSNLINKAATLKRHLQLQKIQANKSRTMWICLNELIIEVVLVCLSVSSHPQLNFS
jgi:hypothetical protein